MESFAAAGVTGIIEVAPAGALVGLAKRGAQGRAHGRREDARRPARRHRAHRAGRLNRAHTRKPSMTKPTLQQSHGPAYTRIYAVGAARGENAVPNDDLDRPDQLVRRVDPAAHRHRRRARAPAPRSRRPTSRRMPRRRRSRSRASRPSSSTSSSSPRSRNVAADAVDGRRASPTASARTPPPPTTRTPPAPGYAYAVAQADALIRTGRRRTTRSSSAPRSSPTSSTRPTARSRSSSATAPARSSSARATSPASPARSGAPTARRPDAVGMNAHAHGVPRRGIRVADAAPGGPDGLPLGRVGHGEGREAGAGCRGRHERRPRRLHPPPGEHAHHRRVREAARSCPSPW